MKAFKCFATDGVNIIGRLCRRKSSSRRLLYVVPNFEVNVLAAKMVGQRFEFFLLLSHFHSIDVKSMLGSVNVSHLIRR